MSVRPATEVALAIVVDGGRCLVQRRRSHDVLDGLWEFPGGKVRPGETPEAAAARECAEETGLAVEAFGRLSARSATYPHGDIRLYPVVCRFAGGEKPRGSPGWVEIGELCRLPMPHVNAEIIAELRAYLGEASRG